MEGLHKLITIKTLLHDNDHMIVIIRRITRLTCSLFAEDE